MSTQREFNIPGAAEADAEARETRARIEREARERAASGDIAARGARQFADISGPLFNLFSARPNLDGEKE